MQDVKIRVGNNLVPYKIQDKLEKDTIPLDNNVIAVEYVSLNSDSNPFALRQKYNTKHWTTLLVQNNVAPFEFYLDDPKDNLYIVTKAMTDA